MTGCMSCTVLITERDNIGIRTNFLRLIVYHRSVTFFLPKYSRIAFTLISLFFLLNFVVMSSSAPRVFDINVCCVYRFELKFRNGKTRTS